ncbi:ParB/RepB/Spo0J family partition protein [Nonomuraea terrae]|uniref:ParB/RepB/Spo0J family partition protein n=1 Tax=Nonomuraea terrae TaxID=2530383 RepID=A0A4R4ZAM1_9ACTN|nr:ParB/RepB/Spo0J family partition protein [Nonomuraea terrae]TDD55313.1 ParB/RepB/Spo0J family partition protein [Nonomuraea terrae]
MTIAASGRRTSLASLRVGSLSDVKPQWPTAVKFSDMADNPDNPRETLRDLEGLAATIKERGILQDLVVVPRENWLKAHPEHDKPIEDGGVGDKPFVILIGHRRRHAGELAGLEEGPVRVREDVASTSRQDALIENVQRDDLSPLEEAHAIRDLMEEEGLSQGKVAAVLGKTAAWVSQRLALLGLRPELQQALVRGELRIEDARKLGKLPHEEQVWPQPAQDPPATAPGLEPTPQPPSPGPPAHGGIVAGGVASRSEPTFGTVAGQSINRQQGESRSGDELSLNEALRIEAAANTVGNLRALRRVATQHPEKARGILRVLEDAVNELRSDLSGNA